MKKFAVLIALLVTSRFMIAQENSADMMSKIITELEKVKDIAKGITTQGEFDAIHNIFKQISFLADCMKKTAKDNLKKDHEDFDSFQTEIGTCVDTHITEMQAQLADAVEDHPKLATAHN